MLNDNEWLIVLLSLAEFVAGLAFGCGFLMTGELWRVVAFCVAGLLYWFGMAWCLERGG